MAKVIPLYKKGDSTITDNYRPISLLPTLSKVLETIVYNQLFAYFSDKELFYPSQYGFRRGHSTELAATELIDLIIQKLDAGKLPLAIFLDMSKAFDTLNHDILLDKLRFYGITSKEICFFKSYLNNRTQYVDYDGTTSDIEQITTGVPQGSILGPLLFVIYINDISNASNFFKAILYADDSTLITSLDTSEVNINYELSKISNWLKLNMLSINVSKSKFIVFHMPQKGFNIPSLNINNTNIERVTEFNFLGIIIHQHLKWDSHINKIAMKISSATGIIYKLKKIFPQNILLTLYNTLILPHIHYGILLWGYNLNRICILQKKAIRAITLSNYISHTEPIFKRLGILKIEDIFLLNELKFCFRLLNNNLPVYFKSIQVSRHHETHSYNTRNKENVHRNRVFHVFAEKCIRFSVPSLLNSINKNIINKINTHSYVSFIKYAKYQFLDNYSNHCSIPICYVCQQNR